jgi:hypothetical protein
VRSFLASFDRVEVAGRLEEVVAYKVTDPHMSAGEQARMWGLVRRHSPGR